MRKGERKRKIDDGGKKYASMCVRARVRDRQTKKEIFRCVFRAK